MIRKALFATTAALALVGLAAAPSAAQYGPDGPTLSVDKGQVSQGSSYTLNGAGFEGDTTYEIGSIYSGEDAVVSEDDVRALPTDGNSADLGTVTTDAAGTFTTVLDIAADARLGFYEIGIDTDMSPTGEIGPNGEILYSAIASVMIEVVAAPVAVPATTATNGGANSGSGGGTLPRTGATTLPLVGAGLGLLAAGGALLFVNKRRSIV